MPEVDPPNLDPRSEDEVTADAVSNLPAELTDRNPSSDAVKLIEACGAFFGSLLFYLNRITERLYLVLLSLVGIEREPATTSNVTLEFTAASGSSATVPQGAVVKTGPGTDAISFETDSELALSAGATDTVDATALEAGAAGNVAANELETLENPISGVDSVTNPSAASGGQDVEPIDELKDRAPTEFRKTESIITGEDFTLEAESVEGVDRALPIVDQGTGSLAVHLVDTQLNENGANASLQTDVEDKLDSGTIPGTVITAAQKSLRLFYVTDVEVEYAAGADQSATDDRIETALEEHVTAVDLFDAQGNQLAEAWPWGEPLYEHEIISLIDQVDGVERVGAITYATSDDYGSSWTTTQSLDGSIKPGWNGADDTTKGLFEWGAGYSPPSSFSVTPL